MRTGEGSWRRPGPWIAAAALTVLIHARCSPRPPSGPPSPTPGRGPGEDEVELVFSVRDRELDRPIAGATLRLDGPALRNRVARTGADGRGRFRGRTRTVGAFRLRAGAPGYLALDAVLSGRDLPWSTERTIGLAAEGRRATLRLELECPLGADTFAWLAWRVRRPRDGVLGGPPARGLALPGTVARSVDPDRVIVALGSVEGGGRLDLVARWRAGSREAVWRESLRLEGAGGETVVRGRAAVARPRRLAAPHEPVAIEEAGAPFALEAPPRRLVTDRHGRAAPASLRWPAETEWPFDIRRCK
ncbi:MAG: hypothetical protein R3F20_11990 [Planctomycetota bacterium]